MLTAFLTDTPGASSVRLTANGWHVATYPITQADGDGPVPAATAVLGRNGWRVASEWLQEFGGVTGRVWVADAEQAPDRLPA